MAAADSLGVHQIMADASTFRVGGLLAGCLNKNPPIVAILTREMYLCITWPVVIVVADSVSVLTETSNSCKDAFCHFRSNWESLFCLLWFLLVWSVKVTFSRFENLPRNAFLWAAEMQTPMLPVTYFNRVGRVHVTLCCNVNTKAGLNLSPNRWHEGNSHSIIGRRSL
jgi:hypothetical protein